MSTGNYIDNAMRAYCEALVASAGPIKHIKFVDVRQSMRNGGGPACLRLRVVMTEEELAQSAPKMRLDDDFHSFQRQP